MTELRNHGIPKTGKLPPPPPGVGRPAGAAAVSTAPSQASPPAIADQGLAPERGQLLAPEKLAGPTEALVPTDARAMLAVEDKVIASLAAFDAAPGRATRELALAALREGLAFYRAAAPELDPGRSGQLEARLATVTAHDPDAPPSAELDEQAAARIGLAADKLDPLLRASATRFAGTAEPLVRGVTHALALITELRAIAPPASTRALEPLDRIEAALTSMLASYRSALDPARLAETSDALATAIGQAREAAGLTTELVRALADDERFAPLMGTLQALAAGTADATERADGAKQAFDRLYMDEVCRQGLLMAVMSELARVLAKL